MSVKNSTTDPLIDLVRVGDQQTIARLLTMIERRVDGVDALLAALHSDTGRAHVIGITGPPGSGKSTLVSSLAREYRLSGRSVGILAIDPSSVYSGGAILGDRIRMGGLAGDDGVFIRSLATRGALGGLSRAALDCVTVLDAAGKDIVILETVGVGQAEVDVVRAAHSVAVVSVPGLGDEIQTIKAGLLEIADIHVVNKADREGSGRTNAELRAMLHLAPYREGQWEVPIVPTIAIDNDGVKDLVEQFDLHREWLTTSGEIEAKTRQIAARRIQWLAKQLISDVMAPGLPAFDFAANEVAAGRIDPLNAVLDLVQRIGLEHREIAHE